MTDLTFGSCVDRACLGFKGPAAATWLEQKSVVLPDAPNTWAAAGADGLLVARLGSSEFFLEDAAVALRARALEIAGHSHPPGVYPVLREDAAFVLQGDGANDVLAQICSVDFAQLALSFRPVVMTLMIGVGVLVVPRVVDASPHYRIWCDPTFGDYLREAVGQVVLESGGRTRGETE